MRNNRDVTSTSGRGSDAIKLFTSIFDDAKLLPHFLDHYSAAGVGEFYVLAQPEFAAQIEALRSAYVITMVATDLSDSCYRGEIAGNEMRALRRRHQRDDEWVVIVDLDEFVAFPEALNAIIAAAEADGANVVRGVMYDRFGADGSAVDFAPGEALAERYPVRTRFVRDVMRGCDHKAVVVKGLLEGVPGGEHHEMVGEKLATQVLDIDHYKWTAGSVERLRERVRGARGAGMEWAVEYERALVHYERHGRFTWTQCPRARRIVAADPAGLTGDPAGGCSASRAAPTSRGQRLSDTRSSIMHPAERLRGYLRAVRLLIAETRELVRATERTLSTQLADLRAVRNADQATLVELGAQIQRLAEQLDGAVSARAADHAQLVEILLSLNDHEHWRRQRLREVRESVGYADAYSLEEPLISVVIPTYDNYELLRTRAIPSVLAQTYENFEIVIVGDAAGPQTEAAVAGFDDPRISYANLPYRGPYPADPARRWLVAGVPPYNEAVRLSTGRWIAPLDDDDAFRPMHLERLLMLARQERLELAYSQISCHVPGGSTTTIGRFPPEAEQFGVQSSLYNAALADVFELELADAALGLPYDWGLCRRMMQAGVRVRMLDEETVDYYPSKLWSPRWGTHSSDTPGDQSTDEERDDPLPPEWEYVPEGWQRARRPDAPTAGWDVAEVARAYREKWPRFLEALAGPGPLGIGHEVQAGAAIGRDDIFNQNAVLAFSYALARAASPTKTLSVLDWGGALGHHFMLARRLFPDLDLEYHCRELPSICAQGRSVLPEVEFHDGDDCLERRYDLVLASGSLQYCEDWQPLLTKLAAATRGWLFLTRAPIATRHPSFVVLQRAHAYGYGTEYLGWVFNRDELLRAAQDANLALAREFVLLPGWTIHGAPDQVAHAGFLFRDGTA